MSRVNVSPFVKQCFVTTAVGLNIVSHGCAFGFPAILLPQLEEPGSGFHLTKSEASWVAAIFPLSMLAGNFLTTSISDRFGRKKAHITLAIPLVVGWVVTVLATNVKLLIFGRLIAGISGGILNTLRSVLIGEYTSPKNRGAFLATISLAQTFGVFFVHLIGSLVSWQMTALICGFSPFVSLLMIIYTPESPSWLAGKGRFDECSEVFRWLRGDEEESELQKMIEAQIERKKDKLESRSINSNRFSNALETIRKMEFYKPIILMVHARFMMSLSGGNTMASYSTVILGLIMGSSANVHFWMVFLDTQRMITNVMAVYIINKVKRRTLMFFTGAVNVISQFAIAFYVYGKTQGWMTSEGTWLPAILINIQFFTIGLAMLPLPNVIGGEIFPLEYRSISATINMAVGGSSMFLGLKTFPSLLDFMGLPGTYILYAVIVTYSLSVMWVLLPETKGKTLQEIEDEFRGRPLKPHEIEARQSLQSNPVAMNSREITKSKSSVHFE